MHSSQSVFLRKNGRLFPQVSYHVVFKQTFRVLPKLAVANLLYQLFFLHQRVSHSFEFLLLLLRSHIAGDYPFLLWVKLAVDRFPWFNRGFRWIFILNVLVDISQNLGLVFDEYPLVPGNYRVLLVFGFAQSGQFALKRVGELSCLLLLSLNGLWLRIVTCIIPGTHVLNLILISGFSPGVEFERVFLHIADSWF